MCIRDRALNNGQVDAVVIDNEPAKAYVESNPGLKILDTSYAEEDYAIGMNKSNTALLEACLLYTSGSRSATKRA